MNIFRIGSLAFNIYDGTGASLYGGRWNSPGRPVIYCGLTLAACQLEILVHLDKSHPPLNHGWISIDIPDHIAFDKFDNADLPAGWDDPLNTMVAQDFGDAWLSQARTAILQVPSVAAANDWVIALNPHHPDFGRFTTAEPQPLSWDKRLFGK